MSEETLVQLRLCSSGQRTFDVDRNFARVPCIGEYIDHDHVTYRVVDVHWFPDDGPLIVAHTLDRPRALDPFNARPLSKTAPVSAEDSA